MIRHDAQRDPRATGGGAISAHTPRELGLLSGSTWARQAPGEQVVLVAETGEVPPAVVEQIRGRDGRSSPALSETPMRSWRSRPDSFSRRKRPLSHHSRPGQKESKKPRGYPSPA